MASVSERCPPRSGTSLFSLFLLLPSFLTLSSIFLSSYCLPLCSQTWPPILLHHSIYLSSNSPLPAPTVSLSFNPFSPFLSPSLLHLYELPSPIDSGSTLDSRDTMRSKVRATTRKLEPVSRLTRKEWRRKKKLKTVKEKQLFI